MPREFYDQLADALVGFLKPSYRRFESRTSARNIKVWFAEPAAEHYEVQSLSGARLEVGFHAEHSSAERNDAAVAAIVARERAWRRALKDEAEAGAFIGIRGSPWRRISEVWTGTGLQDPETAIEAAERLAAYIHAFEPIRLGRTTTPEREARRKRIG